jgi:chemotaxis protein CheC
VSTLDPTELDAVRELINIASGNAATALSMLVGQRTMISVPRVTLEPIERIASITGTPNEPTVVITMQMLGDVAGFLLFLMPVARAHALSAMLLGLAEPKSGDFDASGRSSLQETANMLAGAYVGALGLLIQGTVMITVPAFGIEPPDDVLERYRQSAASMQQALCIETSITIGTGLAPCGAHIVLLPLDGAVEALVGALQLPG